MTPAEFRAFALSLPGMTEASHQGHPDFRLRNKIVANLDEASAHVTIKVSLDDQAALLARADSAFSLPGGWAKHGWTTIHLDRADRDDIEELVTDAWRRTGGTQPRP